MRGVGGGLLQVLQVDIIAGVIIRHGHCLFMPYEGGMKRTLLLPKWHNTVYCLAFMVPGVFFSHPFQNDRVTRLHNSRMGCYPK